MTQAEAAKRHYAKNREKMKARARAYTDANRERIRAYVREYKERHPCVDCENDNWIVLQFDHVRGEKIANVADMVRRSVSLKRVAAEIEKCEVVCANCHEIRTYQRRGVEK